MLVAVVSPSSVTDRPTREEMFYSHWFFLGLGIGITAESLAINSQLITDVVDLYNVTLLTMVYEEGEEHKLDYSLCQSGVVVCMIYSEDSLEALIISLEVAMQNGDLTTLFFIGTNTKLLRTLNYQIFTKGLVFIPVNESDSEDGQGILRLDSNVIFYAPSGMGDEVKMLEKYQIGFGKHGQIITRLLGTWTIAGGFRIMKTSLWERRSDLFGVNLRTGVLRWFPFLDYDLDKDRKKPTSIKGYMAEIFLTLQSRLNFTITLSIPDDGMYGTRNARIKGSEAWNGLVGMLMRKEIDVQATGLNWLAERDGIIDYVMPVLSSRNTLLTRVSNTKEIQLWVYIDIFSYLACTVHNFLMRILVLNDS